MYSSDFIVIFYFIVVFTDKLLALANASRLKCHFIANAWRISGYCVLINNAFISRNWIIHRDGKMEVKEVVFH